MGAVEGWDGAKVFVATSTSGLAASLLPAEKERIWKELGDWVVMRRKERGVDGVAGSAGSGNDTMAETQTPKEEEVALKYA